MTLTYERLRELLSYDERVDKWTWRIAKNGRIHVGDIAGSFDAKGYLIIKIDRRSYKAHRLVWFWVNRKWPDDEIDHKNGNKADNTIANLRLATRTQNSANMPCRKDSSTGIKGVFPRKRNGRIVRYETYIRDNSCSRYLGSFKNPDDAAILYASTHLKIHGQFSRTK